MAKLKSISIPVTGNTAPLRKSLKEANKELTAFGKAQQGILNAQNLAYSMAGTAVAKFALDAVKGALSDAKSQALLADQLRKTTGATDANIIATEKFVTGLMLASNVADDDLRPALAQLVRATGSSTKAQELLSLATNVAAGSGKEFSSVVTAISKAAMGQFTALSKLGVPLSEGALKSGDFAQAQRELNAVFGGAAATAAGTLDGQLQNLNLRYGELKETIGYQLLPFVEELSGKLKELADVAEDKGPLAALTKGLVEAGVAAVSPKTYFDAAAKAIKGFTDGNEEAALALSKTTNETGKSAAAFRVMDGALSDVGKSYDDARTRGTAYQDAIKKFVDEQTAAKYQAIVEANNQRLKTQAERLEKAKQKAIDAKKAYKDLGATLRADLNRAIEDAQTRFDAARIAADEFGQSIAGIVQSGASLSSAYSIAANGEEDYAAAVQNRKDAYEDLAQAEQTRDLDAYQAALDRVAKAEVAVSTAQSRRTNYAAAFAEQIAAAKNFSTNLQTLINPPYNLGEAGLNQLLDLGPVAGAEVAKALVDGTAGFTAGGLNESLAGLSASTGGLAADVSRIFRQGAGTEFSAAGDALTGLLGTSISGNAARQTYNIIVNAGVGDPDAVSKAVVKALQNYNTRFGRLPVTV